MRRSAKLDNVYQSTPSGDQIESQTVAAGGSAVYHVQLQNDGNTRRSFVIKPLLSPSEGWTLSYKVGLTDITADMSDDNGYPINLAPRASTTITVRVMPGSSLAAGATKSTTLRVFLDSSTTTVRDAVRATTTVGVP